MIQGNFHNAGNDCKANFCGVELIVRKNLAKVIGTIAITSASGPLLGNDFNSGASQLANNPIMRAANNEVPVAAPDRVELKASANAFNVLANDSDADGDRLVIVEAIADFGAVAFTREGLLAYAQNPGPKRPDRITYIVSDGRGGFAKGLVEVVAR